MLAAQANAFYLPVWQHPQLAIKIYGSTGLGFMSNFPFKLILAPMEGITHPLIRHQLADHGGLDLLCTEFIRISVQAPVEKVLKKQIVKSGDIPLSVQIMGNKVELMAESAKAVVACGADAVDVNMGCPTKRAVKGGVGSAMLKDPDLCYRVLAAMRQEVPNYLSAKIRAGFDDTSTLNNVVEAIESAGTDYLAVHPRRRVDQYEGHSNWSIIAELKEKLSIPVIGNGDVCCVADVVRMFAETGCDGVMIGRGALANPWIFQQSRQSFAGQEIYLPDADAIYQFYEKLSSAFADQYTTEKAVLTKTKEMLMYFSINLRDAGAFRKLIGRSMSLTDILNNFNSYIQGSRELCGREICGTEPIKL